MAAKTRFGSAGFANTADLIEAGLVNNGKLHHGFTLDKVAQSIGFTADTGTVILGSAGSGKFTTYYSYQLLNRDETTVALDCKGEAAATTVRLMPDVDGYCFNPYKLWSDFPWYLPSHSFNLLDCLIPNSPTFFEDALNLALNLISKPKGGGSSEHFHGKAVQLTCCCLISLRENNPHGSLADLYNMLADIRGGQEDYFATLYYPRMKNSQFSAVAHTADELMVKRKTAPAEFESILSTVSNSLQCLGSPALQMALSGKSAISVADICKPSERPKKVFIMLPANMLEACASIIRCFFTSIAIEQQRNPLGRIHLQIDECGQLGQGFELVKQLYSYGRGSKTKISTYWQNYGQILDCLGREGSDTVLGNAQAKVFLGISSLQTAKFVSEYLGKTTYQFAPKAKQLEAAYKRNQAFMQGLQSGDIASRLLTITKEDQASRLPDAVARDVYTADELMNLDGNLNIVDIKGIGIKPYIGQKIPYFLNPQVAHKFLPNPFVEPHDKLVLPVKRGKFKTVKLVEQDIPESISQLPQFNHRESWVFPEGHCPIRPTRKRFFFLR